jgi:hypothetical protein
MTTRALMFMVGRAAAVLAAGAMLTAPSASAGSDFCNSLPPAQIRDCTCGADYAPGTQEYGDCLKGILVPPVDAPPPSP